ncbi:rod-binding protein [Brevundimonas staleyi]|uniref:Rod-binding protein n=1 Tax=Brevundimonas staleyi TaxID=74326 RepID=A0ABW0FPZ0_9CAUL
MSDLAVSPSLLTPNVAAPTARSEAETARMRATAEQFEASFLSQMLKPMFEGISTDGPFGGGEAEGTWRSFMIDAMAKQTVRAGGIGLADTVVSEMIRMQTEQSQTQPGATA